ncbi:MAG: helix-turn-helix domain-containing protein [Acidimicrobiales bacterium]
MAETPRTEGADRGEVAEAAHAGEQLQRLRTAAGMTVEEVAERAGVDVDWLRRLEAGEGTHDVFYSQWTALVRATQPARPEWWDDGYEHDLSLPPDGHREPTTDSGRRYWARVAAVAAEIEEHYGRGRTG